MLTHPKFLVEDIGHAEASPDATVSKATLMPTSGYMAFGPSLPASVVAVPRCEISSLAISGDPIDQLIGQAEILERACIERQTATALGRMGSQPS